MSDDFNCEFADVCDFACLVNSVCVKFSVCPFYKEVKV